MEKRYLVSSELRAWAQTIGDARVAIGISQGEMHKLTGIQQAFVSQVETGRACERTVISAAVYEKMRAMGDALKAPAPTLAEIESGAQRSPGRRVAKKAQAPKVATKAAAPSTGSGKLDSLLMDMVLDGRLAPADAKALRLAAA